MNKKLTVALGVTLVALTAVVYLSKYHDSTFTPSNGNGWIGENIWGVAGPEPTTDNITCTLPKGASPLRLSLPASIDNIFYSKKTGVGGFGLHAGGHIEGLDHPWIELKKGTPVKSWADGRVTNIEAAGMEGEYFITIDYGENLIGIHMEIMTSYVEVEDYVHRGQEVGLGLSFDPEQSSAELALVDFGRTDGVIYDDRIGGVYVSPYDYLENSEKQRLVAAYKEYVLDRYSWGETDNLFLMFEPYQPYLTNQLFLHRTNLAKLTGEWYSTTQWEVGYPNDMLTFIEAENPYYRGNVVLASDDETETKNQWNINGTFEVDYENRRIKMTDKDGAIYYGIFEIDDSGARAKLKIEYQEGSYPAHFTNNALNYIERINIQRRQDAVQLGVRESP